MRNGKLQVSLVIVDVQLRWNSTFLCGYEMFSARWSMIKYI